MSLLAMAYLSAHRPLSDEKEGTLFSNRSAVNLVMGQCGLALSDAEATQALRPTWVKPYHRKAMALLHLGIVLMPSASRDGHT